VARSFFALAKVGAIDADTGDYLPPVRADTLQMVKQVVMASDAVGAAPMILIAREIESGQLAALSWSAPWLRLHYGFLYRRDRMLSPAAEAFIAEVRAVEARIAADEQRLRAIFDTSRAGAALGR
jgi:DNA-binding transcriptional LysR family regulator